MRFDHWSIAVLSVAGAALLAGCSTGTRSGDGLDATTAGQGATPGAEAGATPGAEAGATPGVEAGATPGAEAGATPGAEAGATPGAEAGATPGAEAGATPGEEEACSGGLLFDGVTCADDCTSGVLGDGVTCQDPSTLIAQGTPICEEAGLVLRDLQFDKGDYEVCGGGVREATYLCCPPWPEPPPEEPPSLPPPLPPPWEGPGCTAGLVGDGATCEDPTALKDEAFAICQALGLPLRYFDAAASMPCGAGSLQAVYACCP
ncbi:hypothetical protein [Sorangium sp. So ce590]|uniref:hypothetical protein n=1 Tax=unclassified Sorangium TaxID=2621164 RepID=UPI003F63D653